MSWINKLVAVALLLILPLIGAGIAERNQQAQAADPVPPVALRWKLAKGMTFDAEIATDTTQKMKVLEEHIDHQHQQTFRFRWTVQGQDPNDNWLLSQRVDRYQAAVAVGGNRLPRAQLIQWANFRQALLGTEFTVTLSPELKIVKIDGRGQFANRLAGIDPQLKPWLARCFSEDLHKQLIEAAFGGTSPRAVQQGESWARNSRLDLGPLGWCRTKHRCTYEGRQGSLERITEELAVNSQPPTAPAAEELPFRIQRSDLKNSSEASAVLLFDRERGRLVSSDTYLDLKGKVVIEIGGMDTEVELHQTQKTVVKLTEIPTAMQ